MLEETIQQILQAMGDNVAIGGVTTLVGTIVTVEAIKYAKLITTGDQARLANVIVALLYGALFASIELFPQIGPVAQTIFVALVGSVGAAIAYNKVTESRQETQSPPEG